MFVSDFTYLSGFTKEFQPPEIYILFLNKRKKVKRAKLSCGLEVIPVIYSSDYYLEAPEISGGPFGSIQVAGSKLFKLKPSASFLNRVWGTSHGAQN